jgi:flagellar hook-associated protein 1 FlgK
MTGTFSSLSTTLSALRYNRVAMDVAGGNVANVGTEGYARRNAVGQAQGAPSVPAMWSRWDGAGNGVSVGGVDRMVDPFLDARGRIEHGNKSFLETRSAALVRVENQLGEPGDGGVAASLTAFQQSWHDVANNPGDGAARSQLLGRATTLTVSLGSQARTVGTEWADQRTRLGATVTEVNGLASDLARVNESIKVAEVSGTDAGLLLDKRDQITMRLSQLTGATSTLDANGVLKVEVGGALLVDGTRAGSIAVSGEATYSATAAGSVKLTVTTPPPASASQEATSTVKAGTVGAQLDLLKTTLPDYLGKLDTFAASVADQVNTLHKQGYDLQNPSEAGVDIFVSSDGQPITAATIRVAELAPEQVAASRTRTADGGPTLDGSNADALGSADIGGSTYRQLVTNFGAQVASARRVSESQSVLTSQIDAAREAVSGINIDEEMVNLLAAQRAYEGAARVMTTIDSILDTLINRTGITR